MPHAVDVFRGIKPPPPVNVDYVDYVEYGAVDIMHFLLELVVCVVRVWSVGLIKREAEKTCSRLRKHSLVFDQSERNTFGVFQPNDSPTLYTTRPYTRPKTSPGDGTHKG